MFEDVYREYFKSIYNYIYFRVGNHHDAEDLTADVFVRAYEYLHGFNGEKGGMRAWLGGIARNMVNTFFAKTAGRAKIIELSEFMPANVDIEGEYQRGEDVRLLMSHIRKLPESKRELLAMKYFLGLTNREIAKSTGMSESNVGSTVHRIIGALQKKYF